MTNLARKFNNIFLLKLSYKNSCVKFDAFSRRDGSIFFLKRRRWEAKVLNTMNVPYMVLQKSHKNLFYHLFWVNYNKIRKKTILYCLVKTKIILRLKQRKIHQESVNKFYFNWKNYYKGSLCCLMLEILYSYWPKLCNEAVATANILFITCSYFCSCHPLCWMLIHCVCYM